MQFGFEATGDAIAKAERQMAYVQQVERRSLQRNQARAQALKDNESAISKALEAYRKLEDPDIHDVRIRTGFIYTDDKRRQEPYDPPYSLATDVETRPMMTKLVARRSHALKLLLTIIYVAHMHTSPGSAFDNDHPNILSERGRAPWLLLSGMSPDVPFHHRRYLRRSLNVALDRLAALNVVALSKTSETAGRYSGFTVMREDGFGRRYTVPAQQVTSTRAAVILPVDFFRQGWHLVLTDLELVTLLAIIDFTGFTANVARSDDVAEIGVGLGIDVRRDRYGLSGEAYHSIHMLHKVGIIDVIDPMPQRRNGRLPSKFFDSYSGTGTTESNSQIPYRLVYPSLRIDQAFQQPAMSTLLAHLQ
jgi:hypothetical protein